jgi:hypothetical protein
MSKVLKTRKAKPYTVEDMRAVSDNPYWKRNDFNKATLFEEEFPELAGTLSRRDSIKPRGAK